MPREKINLTVTEMDLNRSVFLFNIFQQKTSEKVIKQLLELDQVSADPIFLFINSFGGEIFSLFAILDTMSNMRAPVNTICLGEADSCGAVLLSAGDTRFIGQRSRTMIHEVNTFTGGKISELEEDLANARKVNDKLVSILADNTSLSVDELNKKMKKDTFLNAEESLEIRIVDFILDDSALEKDEEDIFNFINSFSGHTRDENIKMMLYNKKDGGGRPDRTNKTINGLKNIIDNKKGENIMDKEQLIAQLKDKFNTDVASLQNSVATLTTEVSAVTARAEKAETELVDFKKETERGQIKSLLDSLIDEKKSTQNLNEAVYEPAFIAAGIEKAREMAKALQPLDIKISRASAENTESSDDTADVKANSLDTQIKAYMKEHNTDNYSVAADLYIAELNKKGETE